LEKFIPEVLVDWKPGQQELLLRVDETVRHIRVPPLNTISDVIPVLRRVYRTVQAHMESDIESPRVEYVALNGLLQSLDPHSVLLAPELNKEFRLSAHGSFGGLGIVIGIRDGELTVIAPLEGTPAYRAGIKSKDKIVQIEDESTVNMDLIEAVSKLRGEPGTAITISIMRENLAEPKEVHIVRELIKIHAVEAYALGDGVGYVTIKNFQENTLRDLSEAVRNFRRKNSLRGLVLDLRNNPGGLFDQAVAVADKFIDEGTIVVTVGANRTDRRPSYARGWRTDTQVPMVVLINQGSASASEIVSGALKYRRRAMLVGSPTFGKGSVQQVFDIVGGSALKLSIAQYLLPGERSIQSVGVTPDLLLKPVELPSEDKDREVKFEAFHNGGKEKDLERSFSEWASQAEEPLFKLAYLKEREAEDAREVMELTNEEKANRARGDFAVQIAKRILLAAEGSSRQAVLETAAEVVPRAAKEEEARITSALSKIAIDWSRPEAELFRKPRPASAAPAVAELTFSPEEAEAGQEVTLSLAVTNRGPAPLFRVRALTEAELSLFKKREFILGRIGPGETHRWSLSFTLPKNVVARKEKVTAVVSDSQGPLGKAEGSITIMPLPRPGFSFSYKLFDNGQFGSHGNGDGLPQRQETIALRLAVTNKGPGASAKGLAVLKLERGLEGVFIEVGREEIKDLAPLETRTFDLLFRLKPDFEGGKLPVEVSVIDTVFREVLTAKVDLAKPLAVRRFSPPTIALAEGSTPLSLNRESFNLEGSVTDDGRVASVIVFTNQRKVLYKAGPTEGGSSLTFSTDMALKEGVNEVVVIAQDDQKLLSRQKVVILRGTVPAVARREGGEPVVGQ
jgi:carboxyl-terminal processing protease